MADSDEGAQAQVAAIERAFELLLAASGAPANDPETAGTPRRAAMAWAHEFLDGYRSDAREALGELSPAPAQGGAVVLTGVDFVGVCPHHLLPYRGVAHLAYEPGAHVAGFGRLATLVDVLGHRLALQERLAADLCEALTAVPGARGAAAVLEAEQTCLSMRGEKRHRSRAVVEASSGAGGAAAMAALKGALARAGG